jgi:hypothetical protein
MAVLVAYEPEFNDPNDQKISIRKMLFISMPELIPIIINYTVNYNNFDDQLQDIKTLSELFDGVSENDVVEFAKELKLWKEDSNPHTQAKENAKLNAKPNAKTNAKENAKPDENTNAKEKLSTQFVEKYMNFGKILLYKRINYIVACLKMREATRGQLIEPEILQQMIENMLKMADSVTRI